MRLIDADKLKEELEVNGLGYQYYMLDNAPTVEAIPIEWLRMWFTKKASLIAIPLMNEIESDWENENE